MYDQLRQTFTLTVTTQLQVPGHGGQLPMLKTGTVQKRTPLSHIFAIARQHDLNLSWRAMTVTYLHGPRPESSFARPFGVRVLAQPVTDI